MLREIFQAIAEHPVIAGGCAVFVWFVVADIAAAFRKGPVTVIHNHYTQQDDKHGVNRRGEGTGN